MYIIFTDESGQPGGFDIEKKELVKNTSKYFILSGFMINSDEILKIEEKLRDIKLKYGLNPYHEVKWNTKYKAIGIEFEQIISMKKEIMQIVKKYKNSVVGIVMDKEYCYKNKEFIKDHNDLYSVALHLLMERCCMQITDEKGRKTTEPALIFADSRKNDGNNKLDKELQMSYLRAKNMGTYFVKFPNFCDTLIFADSDYSAGIQIADFCAGAIFRKYEKDDEEFFNILKPSIRKHKGKIEGAGLKLYK